MTPRAGDLNMALALWYTNPLPAARTPEIRMIPVLCRPHTACEKRLHPVPPGEKSPVLLRPSADISGHHPEENPDKQQDSHNTQNRIRHKDRHKKQGNLNIQKHPPQLIHSVSPVHHTAHPVSKSIHIYTSQSHGPIPPLPASQCQYFIAFTH